MVRFRALKGCLGRGCRKMWRTLGCKESRPIRRPFFMQTRKSHGLNYGAAERPWTLRREKRTHRNRSLVQLPRNEAIKRHLSIPSWGLVTTGTGDPDGEPKQKSSSGERMRCDLGKGKELRKITLELCCGLWNPYHLSSRWALLSILSQSLLC